MSSATMTRDELKMALVDHGVDAGGATKKDDLIALYEEHVQEAMADAEFSCDDNEEMALSNLKKKKSTPKSSKKLNDESFVIGDFDVTKLTDDQLSEALIERGLEVGPIVESTRKFYRKKLLASLRDEGLNGSKLDAEVATNGQDSLQNGEFSADDEEVNGSEESKESDKKSDDDQPAVVVKKAKQPVTPQTSPISSLRQRFMGSPKEQNNERFTPTPRRSIHTYKVTETTKQTLTKNKDGTVSHDFDYKKETSSSQAQANQGKLATLLKILPGFFLLLIALVLAYYVYTKRKQ